MHEAKRRRRELLKFNDNRTCRRCVATVNSNECNNNNNSNSMLAMNKRIHSHAMHIKQSHSFGYSFFSLSMKFNLVIDTQIKRRFIELCVLSIMKTFFFVNKICWFCWWKKWYLQPKNIYHIIGAMISIKIHGLLNTQWQKLALWFLLVRKSHNMNVY